MSFFIMRNERGVSDLGLVLGAAFFCLAAIGVAAALSESKEPAAAQDVVFINEEIAALQRDVLDLKQQLQATDVLLRAVMEGQGGWYIKLESLGQLEDFWSDRSGKSKPPSSPGQD